MSALFKFIDKRSTFNPFVITITLLLLVSLVAITLLAPTQVESLLNHTKQMIFADFSWFYILAFSIFIAFLLILSVSSVGNIKLGTNEEDPEFSFLSWMAMLFAAGMGVGLMFYGVAEPLSHFASSITTGSTENKEQEALLYTIFHWGIHAWGVYAVIGLALAYFGFRYKLPLALRSCFYPLLKDRINGRLGDIIDIVALVATLFGIITTLGYGASQLAAGLQSVGIFESVSFIEKVGIIVVVMIIAILSACSGIGKGVKILSEINLGLAFFLLMFVLVTGPTLYLLSSFSDNLGTYFSNVVNLSFKTFVYESENTSWFTGWTVLYWAWWCSWAPFVGLFIARISRGRTIREFIFGVLAIPSLFCVLWFTVFGNGAIYIDLYSAQGALQQLASTPEQLLFQFFNYLPLPLLTGSIALVVICLFFITSADSGIYVLNNIAARDKSLSAPRWQALMWGVLITIIAVTLLGVGGLSALQTMTLIVALPFAILMLIMCVSLWKGITADQKYFETKITPTAAFWTGDNWRDRLDQMLNQTQEKDILRFLKYTALPAMRELRKELVDVHNLDVEVTQHINYEDDKDNYVQISIAKESMRDFVYGIKSVSHEVSEHLINDEQLPHIQHTETFLPMTYFFDGRNGYDVQYMTRKEIIADILKQYDRYLVLMNDVGQELMSHEQTELAE